ncbi:Single-stranded DNA-binding protein, mitochondrial [Dermatophagoides pteronyssinus]|uniref:Single-stranded DNA-binding protein, mitochondrial-like n=2 Tax=Dermatophagoides pteronyssinus TaxID=6956 RepID=A0A6P6Y4B7_DERPT|nr:single-stranded DNA-binding protein, mitochondrial-like [Dermatophagoides pteronyssinus]KAH9422236.1 Single-stranded DNA-binding protein, mitochondrial [Dermatophagoides pteronyssinus]
MSNLTRFNLIRSILNLSSKDFLRSSQFGIITRNLSDDVSDSEQAPMLENVDNFKCLNRVTLMGRATNSATITKLANTDMATFTLVTNEIRRNRSNELIKRSEFHKIQIFIPRLVQKAAQVVQKGSRVLVEGKIGYNVRKGEHGNIHFTNITAENVIFITGNRMNWNQNESDSEIVEEQEQTSKN